MKKLVPLTLLASLILFACNEKKEEKKISKRDYSITHKNAYNDLFLDSMVVVKYITDNAIADSISRRIISFYNTRNYEYAWFSSKGLSEQAMGFFSVLTYSDDTSGVVKKLRTTLDALIAADDVSITENNEKIKKVEMQLTERLIRYTRSNFEKGYVKRKEMERFIPFKKQDPIELADSLLTKKHKDDKYFSDINKPYKLLKEQLQKFVDLVKKKQWVNIDQSIAKLKPGDSSQAIVALKNNLFLLGDLAAQDTTQLYNAALIDGIKRFQQRFGFTPDGKITADLLEHINVSPLDRVKQLLINMNRMRWLPVQPEGSLIVVNTPAFTLTVSENDKHIFSMPVVVGKEGHHTTLFSDRLTTIVFSPYWNVPPSIIKKEILPSMEKDEAYLERNNMEITGEENGLPVVRQLPGPKNSLGKVKFLFPNSFNIYFHDTPAKSLFNEDVRAFSHGCIRLSDPAKMAEYLLKDTKWTQDKILQAMNSGEEKYVKLEEPVPVFITYYTAWVDENGVLNFRDDIYGHDAQVVKKMFL